MPATLKSHLHRVIDRSMGTFAFIGASGLFGYALYIVDPTINSPADFLAKFHTFQSAIDFLLPISTRVLLAILTLIWFLGYKGAVVNELEMLDRIFREDRAPTTMKALQAHRFIPLLGFLLVFAFIAMILLVFDITLYCAVAMYLHAFDLIGNSISLQNLYKTVGEHKIPGRSKPDQFIQERREIVLKYYFDNATFARVALTMAVTASILVLSVYLPNDRASPWSHVPYVLLIVNFVTTGVVLKRWRAVRDKKLAEVDDEENKYMKRK